MVVNPGDLVIADTAGIVIVPREIIAQLLQRLQSHHEKNAVYLASVRRGDFSNDWVDRILRDLSCPLLDGGANGEGVATGLVNGDGQAIVSGASLPTPACVPARECDG